MAGQTKSAAMRTPDLVDRLCEAAAERYQRGRYGTQDAIYLTNCAIVTLLIELVRLRRPPDAPEGP
jgi:hypothetical protein